MKKNEVLNTLKLVIELQETFGFEKFKGILESFRASLNENIIRSIDRKNWGDAIVLIEEILFAETKSKPYFFLSDLESFDFEEEIGLTIDDIKQLLRIELLQFCTVKDILGNVTSYCQHWENQRRICVAMERDLLGKLKHDKRTLLTINKKVIKANLGYYYRVTIKEFFDNNDDSSENDDDHEYEYGSKAYGYDSWDEMAFNEAFEGNSDAWQHYNQ